MYAISCQDTFSPVTKGPLVKENRSKENNQNNKGEVMSHFDLTDFLIIFIILGTLGFTAIVGNFFMLREVVYARNRENAVMQWPSVTGVVVRSEVKVRRTSDDHTEYPDISYTYEVMGKSYRCKQIMPGGEIGGINVTSTLERYPVGAQVTVYYDPRNPKDAVLEQGKKKFSNMLWFMLILMNLFICYMTVAMTRGVLKY
jgi:hypothetical protein